jgi:3'-phosphoadenosine 5'-phosphosulfate sulfotransferase (PAPS reductase)/FAD synthetase
MKAFQLSGGKDSTAALLHIQDHWAEINVYALDSGDMFPEQKAFIMDLQLLLQKPIRWVQGQQDMVIQTMGIPSDLIPFENTAQSWTAGNAQQPLMQSKGDCCFHSKMKPMYDRMVEDGVTTIIRGQRKVDQYKGPLTSGDKVLGIEVWYPIENWSDQQVDDYLRYRGWMPPLYGHGLTRSGDCMTCSAWLGDQRPAYLAKYHPKQARILEQRLQLIRDATRPKVLDLDASILQMSLASLG